MSVNRAYQAHVVSKENDASYCAQVTASIEVAVGGLCVGGSYNFSVYGHDVGAQVVESLGFEGLGSGVRGCRQAKSRAS